MDPMQDLLQKLVETEILNEETKTEITEAMQQHLTAISEKAKQDAIADVTAELNEKWLAERDSLVEALDQAMQEGLQEGLKALEGDIERFRDLEVEYGQKLAEAKNEMAAKLTQDMEDLVESMDAFIELQLGSELSELKESIEEESKKQFGRKVFEAFRAEFETAYHDEAGTAAKLTEASARLQDAMSALEKAEKKIAIQERQQKLQQVLQPLSGRSREVMEAILDKVDTPLLEEAYKTYIGRVLKESTDVKSATKSSEKENKVLAEGAKSQVISGKIVDGTNQDILKEEQAIHQAQKQTLNESARLQYRRLAGLV